MKRTKEQNEAIRALVAVPKGDGPATDKELGEFLAQADAAGLDPLKRHCYGQLRRSQGGRVLSFLGSIDGFRHVAERSGQYEGQEGPQWCGPDGAWRDVWLEKAPPSAARVGVWRSGFRAPCWAVARWDAYAQTKYASNEPTDMWAKFADLMLAKCAEALALRKAFPNDFGGIYTKEEMDQAQPEASPPARQRSKPSPEEKALQAEADASAEVLGLGATSDAPSPDEVRAMVTASGPGAEATFKAIVAERSGGKCGYTGLTGSDRAWVWAEYKAWAEAQAKKENG